VIEIEAPEVGDWIDAAVRQEESFLAGVLEGQRLADPTLGKTVRAVLHLVSAGD
jgi:hypothetical protein